MEWCLCASRWEFIMNSVPPPEWAVTSCPCSFGHHAEQSRSRWKTTCKLNDWHPSSDISHNRGCQLEKCYATVLYPWKGFGRVLKASTAVEWKCIQYWASPKHCCATGLIQAVFAPCVVSPHSWSCTTCFSHRAPELCSFSSLHRGVLLMVHPESSRIRSFLACKSSRRNSVYLSV